MIAGTLIAAAVLWWAATSSTPARRPPPTDRRARRPVVLALAALAGCAALGPLAGACGAAAFAVAWRWQRLTRLRHTIRAQREAFPDSIELVVLAVRAGHTPAGAVRAVTPLLAPSVRPAFDAVVARHAAGERFADALRALTTHLGAPADSLVDALAAAERYGLPLSPVLDRLAADARLTRRQQAEAAARELPVRLAAPLVLCTLPSFVLLAIVPLLAGTLTSLHT